MGYKRCLEANEFEDLSLKEVKRFECNNEQVSLADIVPPNKAFVKTVISDDDEGGFYNIPWYDPLEADTVIEACNAGDKNVQTSGNFNSCSSEEDTGSGAKSLSSASPELEFDIPRKACVPLDDAYFSFDCSPRKPVPIGSNHQATIPVWRGKANKMSESIHTSNDNEERFMGTFVFSVRDSGFISSLGNMGREGRTECNCRDQGSIRCVRQHVREARENMRKTLGKENFANLGLCDMGEDIALKWSEVEEEVFHEVVYNNPASLGRNFWKDLSATFRSRTNKEIVSYYFNVFMLRRRAAQNRASCLDIDSDDDECHIRNVGIFGFKNSKDDSAIESLGDQDVRVENQVNYSDGDDSNNDDGTSGCILGLTGYDMGNTIVAKDGIDGRSSKCMLNSQIESWSNPIQYFECDTNMDVSYRSHGLVDASSALQSKGFKCDQNPRMHDKLDLSSDGMEHVYSLDDAKDWYPGYSTCPTADVDFLPTSNWIEEFFCHGTSPDKKTSSD